MLNYFKKDKGLVQRWLKTKYSFVMVYDNENFLGQSDEYTIGLKHF